VPKLRTKNINKHQYKAAGSQPQHHKAKKKNLQYIAGKKVPLPKIQNHKNNKGHYSTKTRLPTTDDHHKD
jgi:hypothetical protein